MPNYKRYEIAGKWRVVTSDEVGFDCGDPDDVVVQEADLRDKQTSQVYLRGAYRVSPVLARAFKPKVFFGESAWSDAQRYAGDITTACRRARW
jgi:hypothetical protein